MNQKDENILTICAIIKKQLLMFCVIIIIIIIIIIILLGKSELRALYRFAILNLKR